MKNEIWKPVKDRKGFEVSNMGRVRANGEMVRFSRDTDGYLLVNMKGKTRPVHRLVAEAFISNPYDKPVVDHINTVRTDNRVVNLRWATQKENMNNPKTISNRKEHTAEKRVRRLPEKKKTGDIIFVYDEAGLFIKDFYSVEEAKNGLSVRIEDIFQGLFKYPKPWGNYIYKLIR